jgi:Holliday junction resolvase
MTESQFQQKVIQFLKSIGAYHVKIWGGGFQKAGIPDLLVCYKGKFIGIELKTDKGKASVLQKYNISKIQKAGGIGIVLRPSTFKKFRYEILREDIKQDEYS